MVARGESMFGCYGDSYSYRLWSLANVWTNCQFPAMTAPAEPKDVVDGQPAPARPERAASLPRARAASPPLGPGGPHVCTQCGGAYPTREQLDRHETLHSPSAQSCKICQKSFANVYRLQRHMISHDESALLRKFKCNDCDKAFKFKHHLKEHLRIHSGEKPFECLNCGKKFSHSGSYSSHMTSKKCLVMNLKMGRIKPNNPALNPERSPSRKRPSAASLAAAHLNNSMSNNNSFFSLPKYSEAAAAFLASIAPHDGPFAPPGITIPSLRQLYMPPGLPLSSTNGINPYSLPTSISGFLEHIANSQYHQRKLDYLSKDSNSNFDPEEMIEEITEDDDRRSSVSGDRELVMDIEDESTIDIKQEHHTEVDSEHKQPLHDDRYSPSSNTKEILSGNNNNNNNTLGGLNMILESVNASVTKHLLQANMQKLSPILDNNYNNPNMESVHSVHIKPEPEEIKQCPKCHTVFNHSTELLQHEQLLCGNVFRKHEGLAAQVAETMALNRIESEMKASIHSGVSASEDEDYQRDDTDEKIITHVNERKVRIRTAISDEQQSVLKKHYNVNQRPNREEFRRIAQKLGLDSRVVQVWFQNNRARVRRLNQSIVYNDQPLDLSTKKNMLPIISSPSQSPPYTLSIAHSDSGEEAVNLSQKSSRSPTPYRHPAHLHYQHSNCSSPSVGDYRHSPSPCENLGRGIKRYHSQYKIPSNIGLMSIEKMTTMNTEIPVSHSPLHGYHLGTDIVRNINSSPCLENRSWTEDIQSSNEYDLQDIVASKKIKIKGLSKVKEGEGQFICDQCDKTFVKQSSLARHKYEHSGQRPYQCVECPRAFKHKHHLTEHKRLHTGEKPFQCCKCFKKFSHSGSFSQHMNHRYSYCKPYRE